jgi:hypothetical protein
MQEKDKTAKNRLYDGRNSASKEMRQKCTFSPRISQRSGSNPRDLSLERQLKRQQLRMNYKSKELKDCTFHPNISFQGRGSKLRSRSPGILSEKSRKSTVKISTESGYEKVIVEINVCPGVKRKIALKKTDDPHKISEKLGQQYHLRKEAKLILLHSLQNIMKNLLNSK